MKNTAQNLRSSKQPKYRIIANILINKIKSGEFPIGSALPTEIEMCTLFDVSRVTVRKAIQVLIQDNRAVSIKGSGTYIKENRLNYEIYNQTSLQEKWSKISIITKSKVISFTIQIPTEYIATKLQIQRDEHVFYIKRLRFADKKPVDVEETWMPVKLFPDLTYQIMQRSKYAYIEKEKQMTILSSEQEIIPVLPNAEISKLLEISESQPIVKKITVSKLQDGTIFEYSNNYLNPANYKFTFIARRNH